MKRYRDHKIDQLGDHLTQQLRQELSAAPAGQRPDVPAASQDLFEFAQFNAAEAERGGYSNYSYWMATIRAFFQEPGGGVLPGGHGGPAGLEHGLAV